jgi:hypothetical protein
MKLGNMLQQATQPSNPLRNATININMVAMRTSDLKHH